MTASRRCRAFPPPTCSPGLQGLSGVLMALLRREQTGVGDYIDISMHDVTVGGMLNILGPTFAEDRQPIAAHERTTGGAAFYRPYETQDGRYLVLAGQEPKFIHNLLARVRPSRTRRIVPARARPAPAAGDGFPRRRIPQEAARRVAGLSRDARCLLRPRQHAAGSASRIRTCVARGMIRRDETGRRHVGPPIRFRHEPAQPGAARARARRTHFIRSRQKPTSE